MNRIVLLGAFVALACMALPALHGEAEATGKKVNICQYTPKNSVVQSKKCDAICTKAGSANGKLKCTSWKVHVISVDAASADAHLKNGDRYAKCLHKKGSTGKCFCPIRRQLCKCFCSGGGKPDKDMGMMTP